jgi:acyl carrier protein phosphodiesterase
MNYLAHLYLSHGDTDLMLGNIAADVVKGNDWQQYPERIQAGILLHRQIDSFTDSHPTVRAMIAAIRPSAGRYAGPAVDILCDHLLATSWATWHDTPLRKWTQDVYAALTPRLHELPPTQPELLQKLIAHDWLLGYDKRHELEYVMNRFNRRLRVPVDVSALSVMFFEERYAFFQEQFAVFFPEMVAKTWEVLKG